MATSSKPAVISVIGSLNVDLVTRTARLPVAGETLASESFNIGWGGKGANQAVACARFSRTKAQAAASQTSDVEVRMVGAVGEDEFHKGFLQALRDDGLNTSKVDILPGQKTGTAVIIVETSTGENRILVNSGANGHVPVQDLVDSDAVVALFQLELPLQVVLHNMAVARVKGVVSILNPAPAVSLPAEAYQGLGHLIVNETEAAILTGIERPTNWDEVAAILIARGVEHVVITLGGEGVYYKTAKQQASSQQGVLVPAFKVQVVDTTAAGDTFAGAYAVAVARWRATAHGADFNMNSAIAQANKAASLTVQRQGAQSSIPWVDEILE